MLAGPQCSVCRSAAFGRCQQSHCSGGRTIRYFDNASLSATSQTATAHHATIQAAAAAAEAPAKPAVVFGAGVFLKWQPDLDMYGPLAHAAAGRALRSSLSYVLIHYVMRSYWALIWLADRRWSYVLALRRRFF